MITSTCHKRVYNCQKPHISRLKHKVTNRCHSLNMHKIEIMMMNATEGVSTHGVVGQLNPCHRGRDVIGGVSSCFRRVTSVLIATASKWKW